MDETEQPIGTPFQLTDYRIPPAEPVRQHPGQVELLRPAGQGGFGAKQPPRVRAGLEVDGRGDELRPRGGRVEQTVDGGEQVAVGGVVPPPGGGVLRLGEVLERPVCDHRVELPVPLAPPRCL